MELENKVEYTVYRDQVEGSFGTLTDRQWEVLSSEVESRLDGQLENILSSIVEELDYLVEQDDKYEPEEEN